MGATLYISFDQPVAGLDSNARDRVFMARLMDDLDNRAKKLNVKQLGDFQSYDSGDAADMLGDDLDEIPEIPPAEYFEPNEALPTIRALIQSVEADPIKASRFDRNSDLLAELRDCESVLTAGATHGAKFRLHIGE